MTVFLFDAAAEHDSDWTRLSSAKDRLTMDDRSSVLLMCGIIAVIGNQFLGIGSDLLGRMFMTECCVVNGVIAMVGFILARSKYVLVAFVCLNPFLKDGAAMVTGSMLAEWLPIQWRGIFIVSLHAFWNVGRLGITILWTIIPPTEHWITFFSLAIVPPITLSIFLRCRGWRYESPRWLGVSGNMEGCLRNLKLAADSSDKKDSLPSGWDTPGTLKLQDDSGDAVAGEVQARSMAQQLAEVNVPHVRGRIAILALVNFGLFYASIGFFFWAIEYFKKTGLTEAIVPAMVAAPIGKILANLVLICGGPGRCIIERSRRTPIMQVGFFGFATCLVLLLSSRNVYVITFLVFIGHIFQEIIWAACGVYITESFPTSVRNTASGMICTVGQLGAILGSSLSGEMMEIWIYLPMVVMAFCLCASGCACFLLPDERHTKSLSDTISLSASEYGATPDVKPFRV